MDTQEKKQGFLRVGDSIFIEEKSYEILQVSWARELGAEFGLKIEDGIPIYWLSDVGTRQRGAFVPEKKIVLFFENTDRETQHHELVHVVEFFAEKRASLVAFYERVKTTITDESFDGDFVSYNFYKNIHEFIADGRSKPAFMAALKKESLYEKFLAETAYLFE